ncbi:AzlD domain-containing protein [Terasakiella sp. A23]|uniref:AzlD domain-containing protein n=1 Tax=Terasakiella sp. FCG-A23 TaxID=3080561 RepID=UPI00295530CF|nr:AzlD domain-containing protein [Terasakiella sp. A23]MDV7338191.1 AzlD domain-containing protein [Terasakiella sp. A23]
MMDNNFWILLGLCASGTLMMRLLPLIWMQRHLAKRKTQEAVEEIPSWLSVFGPAMIAGMFGVSLIPANPSPVSWAATALGVIATLAVWRFTKSLGWPVFGGVLVYGVVILLG